MPKSKRATKAVVEKRTNQVIKMLLLGVSRADIIQFANENWDIGEAATDRYIKKANQHFSESSIIKRDEQLGLAMRRLNDLFSKNMRIDDYKAALSVEKEIISLLGLSAPLESKQDITVNFKYPDDHD